MTERYRYERAGCQHATGLLALFEAAGSGCFCNYWHFEGDKNAWLERCYLKPEDNRAALVTRLAAPELSGVVASTASGVCGWLKVTRAEHLARLYEQRIYRNLPYFPKQPARAKGVYTVACLYIAETERGNGVATALLARAIELTRDAGGSALEAFPRGTTAGERLRPDAVWMVLAALFQSAGFEPVSDLRPYPVLRLHLH